MSRAFRIPDTDRWTGDRVKTILVNQAYIGTTIYGKRKRAKYRNMPEHHTDPKDWVIHENTHESIIARSDFDEVQRIWNRAREKYKESVERGLARQRDIVDSFPQKVKCMECGMTMTYMRYTNFGQSHGIRKGFYYCKEYDGKPGYCRQKVHEDLLKITVMDQIHNMIQAMCDRKVLLEKMKEGSYDKGELVSLRVRIQNMQFKLMKAEETSATLYENFATGLLDEQEYQMLREHYTEEKEKLETGIREAQTRKRVVEKSIEEFLEVEKNLEKYLDERSFNQKMIAKKLEEEQKNKQTDLPAIQKEMEKQLETLREERIRQYEAYAEGMTDQECYLKVKKELNQKIDKIQEKYERLLTITTEDGELMKEIQVVKQEAEQAEVFDKMTRHIAETFIDEVIIYDAEKIEIRFLFDDLIAEMTEKIEREEKEDVAI